MKLTTKLSVFAALLGCAIPAMAVNITIPDNLSGTGFGGGPYGLAGEDNETEPGTVHSQIWDMEAFTIVGNTLDIFGGFNMAAGQVSDGITYHPGDLFIKVGGAEPSGNPTSANGTVPNTYYNYNYAVVLDNGLGTSATVETLNPNSRLNSVMYDQFLSNPWSYASGAASSTTTPITYTAGLTDKQVSDNYGLTLYGGSHNVLSVDLSFLGTIAPGTPVWFSYTMECGNDSIKGEYDSGFRQDVPDGGATLLLLGMGLSVLGMASRKLRTK